MNGNDVRPFVVHLRSEHRIIRAALAKLEEALEEHPDDIYHCIQDLRATLDRHFCEEERDGCADEAVARKPKLAHEATKLCHEHLALLKHADQLLDALGADHWRPSVETLKQEIEAHLEKEASLVESGLNADQELESFQ